MSVDLPNQIPSYCSVSFQTKRLSNCGLNKENIDNSQQFFPQIILCRMDKIQVLKSKNLLRSYSFMKNKEIKKSFFCFTHWTKLLLTKLPKKHSLGKILKPNGKHTLNDTLRSLTDFMVKLVFVKIRGSENLVIQQ